MPPGTRTPNMAQWKTACLATAARCKLAPRLVFNPPLSRKTSGISASIPPSAASNSFIPSLTPAASFGPDPHPWTLIRSELYKQRLPSICTAWASPEGRRLFKEALRDGTAECYLPLSCHFDAQAEPATCGLGTLAMILNAMGMSPSQTPSSTNGVASSAHTGGEGQPLSSSSPAASDTRRSFWTEDNLPVGRPRSYILKHGTDMDDVAATARKAGVAVTLVHARVDSPPDVAFSRAEQRNTLVGAKAKDSSELSSPASPSSAPSLVLGQDVFRRVVQAASKRPLADVFVAMSFSRTALYQTGEGHFSPLGAYHAGTDSVLVLESAKFKYPPHWVPVPLMWAAMQRTDWVTGRPRGYLVVSKKGAEPLDY